MDDTIQKLVPNAPQGARRAPTTAAGPGAGPVGRRHPQRHLLPRPAEGAGRSAGNCSSSTWSRPSRAAATSARRWAGSAPTRKSADEVRDIERAFADVDRARFGWWLRSNGRYLIPGGLRDTLFAGALYLRNLLGTHIEIAIAASLIGMVLAAHQPAAVGRGVPRRRPQQPAFGRAVRRHRPRERAVGAPAGAMGDAVADAVVHAGRALPRVGGAGLRLLVGARQAVHLVDAAAGGDVGARSAPAPAGSGRALVQHYSGPLWLAPAFVRLRAVLGRRAAVGAVARPHGARRRNCATS